MFYKNINYFLFIFCTSVCFRERFFMINGVDILDGCIGLFDKNNFLVLTEKNGEKSWFNTQENITFDGMQDGKWKKHKPCVRQINDYLTIVPNIGYQKDPEFKIECRPNLDLMLWYRGRKSYSVSNRKCKRWDTKAHNFTAIQFGSSIREAQHFCRNPDSSPCGPWCFLEQPPLPNHDREPCFLTCYPEKYLNKSVPCIAGSTWPYATIDSTKYDKLLHSSVLTYSNANCSIRIATKEQQRTIDNYGTYSTPWKWENEPIVGRLMTSQIWGYECLSGKSTADRKFVPTCSRCSDLQQSCIPRNDLLMHTYKGSRNFTVSGKPCISWRKLMTDYILQNKEPQSLTDEFYNYVFYGPSSKFFRGPKSVFTSNSDNSRCINLLALLDKSSFEKFGDLADFQLGPLCFVYDENRIIPEPCFSACEDLTIEILNCIPQNLINGYKYLGIRAQTAINVSCIPWPHDEHNYCRLSVNATAKGPSCFTEDSPSVLQPCFKPCAPGTSFDDVRFNYFGYSPCSQKGFEKCCQSMVVLSEASRMKRQVVLESDHYEVEKLHHSRAVNSVKLPKDLDNQIGTLTESGVWPNVIAEILVWIIFCILFITLVVVWKK